jgi:mycofactocin precursor
MPAPTTVSEPAARAIPAHESDPLVTDELLPTPDPLVTDELLPTPDPLVTDELLVEEISIDGMCGVY